MYNRYIPQPDGTYRRSRMPEPKPTPPPPRPSFTPEPPPPEPPKPPVPPPRRPQCPRQQSRCAVQQGHPQPKDTSAAGFLRRLLPKDFDTGDLMIVLLLLLMAGDCQDDQNTALLTLALYFFM